MRATGFPHPGILFGTNLVIIDKLEVGKKGEDRIRFIVLVPGWKRVRTRQERKDHERRCRVNVGDGGGRVRARWGGQRVHGIRILRVRPVDGSQAIAALAANLVGLAFYSWADKCHGLASPESEKGALNCHITHEVFCVYSSKGIEVLLQVLPVSQLIASSL